MLTKGFIHNTFSSCTKSHSIPNFRIETTEASVLPRVLELGLGVPYLINTQIVLHCFSRVFSRKLVQAFLLNEVTLSLSCGFLVPLEAAVNAEQALSMGFGVIGPVEILGWLAISCLTLGKLLNFCELQFSQWENWNNNYSSLLNFARTSIW